MVESDVNGIYEWSAVIYSTSRREATKFHIACNWLNIGFHISKHLVKS